MIQHAVSITGLGVVCLTASERGLSGVAFCAHADPGRPSHPILRQAFSELTEYAAGCRQTFSIPLDCPPLPTGIRAILAALTVVPYGTTVSYGALASAAGRPRAARLAGNAMARNPLPIVIPCHRVVAANGIGGYSPGLDCKRRLWLIERLPWPEKASCP